MSSETQDQSRRSLPTFTFQHLRSLSRIRQAGVRTPDPLLRSSSRISCDPQSQPAPLLDHDTSMSKLTNQNSTSPTKKRGYEKMESPQVQSGPHTGEHDRRPPRSWFSLSNLSFRLPKMTEVPAITTSIISAPVLTGTTNIDVAEAEGVCCRDTVDAGLLASQRTSGESTYIQSRNGTVFDEPRKSKVRFFRWKGQARKKERPRSLLHGMIMEHNRKLASENPGRLSAIEKSISRRRMETMNLCREKINRLTGNGNVKRKSLDDRRVGVLSPESSSHISDNIKSKVTLPESNTDQQNFLTFNHSDPNIAEGSLTRSFVSAIDKLDLDVSPSTEKMPLIKSKSSIFGFRKRGPVGEVNDGKAEFRHPLPAQGVSTSNTKSPMLISEAVKQAQAASKNHYMSLSGYPAEPLQFSGAGNAYVPTQAAEDYPGGVKALGMHSRTTDFAKAPSRVLDLPQPPTYTLTIEEVTPLPESKDGHEDEDDSVIGDAPIYSPSLGDLSQYARSTPASTQPVKHPETVTSPATPSEVQAGKVQKRKLGLRRSKSGLTLLGMLGKRTKEESSSETPLQTRSNNQSFGPTQFLKKSKSMNLAGFLRRSGTASSEELVQRGTAGAGTFHTKPSPLRRETNSPPPPLPTSTPARDGSQRRTPPRGSITPADRAKRMGVIGMPRASFDEHFNAN